MKRIFAAILALAAAGNAMHAQSAAPLTLEKSIALTGVTGGFNHHSADGAHHRVFLCASTNESVEVMDLVSGKVIKSLSGGKPAATCFAPNINLLCVSRGKTIELYDATSFDVVATFTAPASVDELRYDAAAKRLLGGCMNAPNEGILPIDLAARKVLPEIMGPQPQGFCLEENGSRIFVATPRADQVTVVDRIKNTVAATWPLTDVKGDYPIAFDPATHRVFVGCRRPAKLLVMNSDTGQTVAAVDIGHDTDDLSFDAANRRIYVACGEGVTSVVQQDDADHYRNIANVATAPGARNCVFVPETAQYCVTVPGREGQPATLLIFRAPSAKHG